MPDIYLDVDAAVTVPVNLYPLIDDTDFKTREVAIAYDAAGMDLVRNFVTSAGVITQTAVTPTTSGNYDWTHVGDGIYKIEIPASGGASINNDTEGYGWFSGLVTGVLPWRGPVICFRAAGLNDLLCDSAHSATRGLAGTALPAAAADAAGGLPVSDAGGLDLDARLDATVSSRLASASYTTPPTANQNADALLDRTDGIETGFTFRQIMRLISAVLLGKVSGGATTTNTFRDVNDSKNRVTATVTASGNRTAVTRDAT